MPSPAEDKTGTTAAVEGGAPQGMAGEQEAPQSKLVRIYAHPWTQIILISVICFCCPGVSEQAKEKETAPASWDSEADVGMRRLRAR